MIPLVRRLVDHSLRVHFQIPLVREGGGWRTALIVLGDPSMPCTVSVCLRDAEGRLVAETDDRHIRPRSYVRIECGEVLRAAGIGGSFEGNAAVQVRNYVGGVVYMEYLTAGDRRASTHSLYAGAFRHPLLEKVKGAIRQGQRSRRYTSLYLPLVPLTPDEDYEIALHNLAEANTGRAAAPTVLLSREDGVTREARLSVPPGGTTCRSVRQLFGGPPDVLSASAGLLTVIDNETFLHGLYFRLGRSFVCDHLHFLG